MAVLDVFHWEHIQGIAKACKKMTKVTEEQLGFRTGITDEAWDWLGIYMVWDLYERQTSRRM